LQEFRRTRSSLVREPALVILGEFAKPVLFKHEGLLSSSKAAWGTVIFHFHEEEWWLGASFPDSSYKLVVSLNPVTFSRDCCKEETQKLCFCKLEFSPITLPVPESLYGARPLGLKWFNASSMIRVTAGFGPFSRKLHHACVHCYPVN